MTGWRLTQVRGETLGSHVDCASMWIIAACVYVRYLLSVY